MKWFTRVPANVRDRLPLAATVFVIGSFAFVGPRIFKALEARSEAASLEERAASMRLLRDAGPTAANTVRAVAEFERLVSKHDRVPEVIEILARLAFDPGNPAQARGLLIETGQRASPNAAAAPGDMAGGARSSSLDPRWALFPGSLEYTPITVTFETTYDRLGLFLWRLRDLPTLVEVRSVEIGRSLPLLKVKLVLFALQRTNQAPTASASKPAPTSVPMRRVANAAGAGGTRGVSQWR